MLMRCLEYQRAEPITFPPRHSSLQKIINLRSTLRENVMVCYASISHQEQSIYCLEPGTVWRRHTTIEPQLNSLEGLSVLSPTTIAKSASAMLRTITPGSSQSSPFTLVPSETLSPAQEPHLHYDSQQQCLDVQEFEKPMAQSWPSPGFATSQTALFHPSSHVSTAWHPPWWQCEVHTVKLSLVFCLLKRHCPAAEQE